MQRSGEVNRLLGRLSTERTVISLNEGRLQSIFLSPKYSPAFTKLLQHSLGLARLNPYTPEKPVDRPDMFFGRSTEIRTVLDNSSTDYCVVGSRRIGKSSLLRYLKRETTEASSRIPIYIDCATISNFHDLVVRIAEEVNIRRSRRIELGGLSQLVKATYSVRRIRYLFLLDEIDGLILTARRGGDWRFFEILRGLANLQIAQTVLGGYRHLFDAWRDLSCPLYNFVSPIYLSTLNDDSAKRLATQPMQALGVKYQSSSLVTDIVRETGGHPSFLQFFCSALLQSVDDRRALEITAEDVQAVREKKEYRLFVLKSFEYKDNLTDFERLILLELARARRQIFRIEDLLRLFSAKGSPATVQNVSEAFENLEIAGFFQATQEGPIERSNSDSLEFKWSIPAFPTAVGRTYPVDRYIQNLYDKLRASMGGDL